MTDREKALLRVQTLGFELTEANLFLDTHPKSREALEYYHRVVGEYNNAVNKYTAQFGPLDVTQISSTESWTWTDGCMPWEAECNVEI